MLATARADADRALLTARVQAEAAIERSQAQVADLEAAGRTRTKQYEQIVDNARRSAGQSAAEFRSAGARLIELAEHFEIELASRDEQIEIADDDSIEHRENFVDVV